MALLIAAVAVRSPFPRPSWRVAKSGAIVLAVLVVGTALSPLVEHLLPRAQWPTCRHLA